MMLKFTIRHSNAEWQVILGVYDEHKWRADMVIHSSASQDKCIQFINDLLSTQPELIIVPKATDNWSF